MNYNEQLKDKRWSNKRNKILERDDYNCVYCGSNESLNVHHQYYIKGNLAWNYPNTALITLCNKCHKKWHDSHEIEIRDKNWNYNKQYIPPTKKRGRGKRNISTSNILNAPLTKKEKQKINSSDRLKKKKEEINEFLDRLKIEDKDKFRSFSLPQLKKYFKYKNIIEDGYI